MESITYYAVKVGKIRGIYLTLEDCMEQVKGVPQAEYREFSSIVEAGEYLTEEKTEGEKQTEAVAYVDGSYNAATGEYSCGVVFFCDGKEAHISKKGEDKEMASMRNVAGEILGARLAMEEAVRRGVNKLTIYHDYQGISSWCLGQWKTNKEGTRAYKAYYDSLKDILAVSFQKVKGHSGDKWNDLADELARSVIF